jgi:replicative DNA helicase
MNLDRSYEAEIAVIGSVLKEPKCLDRISFLSAEDFTNEPCAAIYEAAEDAHTRGRDYDGINAADTLKRILDEREASKFAYDCVNLVPTTTNVVEYARIVHNHAGVRRLKESFEQVVSGSTAASDMASSFITVCTEFLQSERTDRRSSLEDAISDAYDDMRNTDAKNIMTGFQILDGIMNGAEEEELILVGARPGVGKTAFGMHWALKASAQGYPVDFYSIEMSRRQLAKRVLSRVANINMGRLFKKALLQDDWRNVAKEVDTYGRIPLSIVDDPYMTVSKIRHNSIKTKNLSMIVIDYLQLLRPSKRYNNTRDAVSEVSIDLKALAKELHVPVVALAQLNRISSEYDRPGLTCLKESGQLEQDADKILFLWRLDEEDAEVIKIGQYVAKNRNGGTGTVIANFDRAHMRFKETDEKYSPKKRKSEVFDDKD